MKKTQVGGLIFTEKRCKKGENMGGWLDMTGKKLQKRKKYGGWVLEGHLQIFATYVPQFFS